MMSTEEINKQMAELNDELVPYMGKADTVAGEMVRAWERIAYRYYNDGDKVGIGYGRDTCNAPARYLANVNAGVKDAVNMLWGEENNDAYEDWLYEIGERVVDIIKSNPELKQVPNVDDMWDFYDKDEDEFYGDPYGDEDEDDEEGWY